MRILVIGGAGFLGTKVISRIIGQGDDVICFDRSGSSERLSGVASKVKVIQGDVTVIEEVIAAIRNYHIDRIVHLACLKTVEAEYQLPRAMRVNVMGTNNVFESARLTGVQRVVFISSVAYYGLQTSFGDHPLTEQDPSNPITVYGYIKALNEHVASRYAELYDLQPVCLRLAFTFGHGRVGVGNAWPTNIVSNPALGKPASLPSDPKRKYCIIYVDDAADIICALTRKERLDHQVYLSGGYTVTLEELARIVKEFIPGARFTYDGKEGDHHYVHLLDSSRLQNEIGFNLPPLRQRVLDHINEARCSAEIQYLD